MKFYTTQEVAELLQIHPVTLLNYVKKGFVKPIKLPSGHYRWSEKDIQQLLQQLDPSYKKQEDDKTDSVVIYGRVSGPGQKKDLLNQIQLLENYCISKGYRIKDKIKDVGSSFNFKRQGLRKLLKYVVNEEIQKVVVYSKDRLSRIAFDLFVELFKLHNVEIEVVDDSDKIEHDWQFRDIAEEIIAFLHYVTSKIYGMRSYKKKLLQFKKELENEVKRNSQNFNSDNEQEEKLGF